MRTHYFLVTCLLAACSLPSAAQSKIDCKVNPHNGRYEAPLAWQNTLGVSRANSMCQDAALLANKPIATPAPAPAVAVAVGSMPVASVMAAMPAAPLIPRFETVNGEQASAALQRWAGQSGFHLIWDAPKQTDLLLNAGVVDGPEFIDAVAKLVTGLNGKLDLKRRSNDAEAPWSLPVEAIKYSNGVVRVVIKQ
jgi:hypothetical protein